MDAVEEVMKNGRRAIKGKCPVCGKVMFKILGGKATLASGTGSSVGDTEQPGAQSPAGGES